ncbi:MAG: response regulator [Acidobacteria bacterium]|nr:response regulator [Acidobacteriota bacterium]
MASKSDDFLKKLLATFKVEAEEHVHALASGFVALEQDTGEDQAGLIETVFREAHSLKGAARAVSQTEIEITCQALESVFSSLKCKVISSSPALFDLLHKAVDALGKLLSSVEGQRTPAEKSLVAPLIQDLEAVAKGSLPLPTSQGLKPEEEKRPARPAQETLPVATERTILAETVRVSSLRLDALLLQAEELLSTKLTARQRAAELREIKSSISEWGKRWTRIHPDLRTIQQSLERNGHQNGPGRQVPQLRNLIEFVEWGSSFVKSLENGIGTVAKSAEQDHRTLGSMVDNLLGDMKKACMLPFSSLLEIFPKLIRDLSRDQRKEVEWHEKGGEVEVDRRILEAVKDPLIHLVRNCIDHGIEKPEERKRKKKPPRGTVTLAVTQQGGNRVAILVSDDGAGIDIEKVRAAAVKLGRVPSEEAASLDEKQVLSFIFHSGVSTSPIITDLSGRGLGLAIVREKVEQLGGTVFVEARPDMGTAFRIVLPLTLATFRGILIRVDEHRYVLPAAHVERVVRVSKEEIKTVENRETIELNGRAVSLVRLASVLELPQRVTGMDAAVKAPAVVLSAGGERIAFLMDEIVAEMEVLVKSLGSQLPRVRNVAGATVLGTGKTVLILDVPDLMKSAVRVAPVTAMAPVIAEETELARKSILVAEDSITARTLLKSILESAGYTVKTAVDGQDAITTLRSEDFDLVVSDVDMPRMNGFDLTAKIRSDKKLSELPVVLVTAMESRSDRERGIDVGANAYIVKSSFDQSNLFEVIRRLI